MGVRLHGCLAFDQRPGRGRCPLGGVGRCGEVRGAGSDCVTAPSLMRDAHQDGNMKPEQEVDITAR